MNGESPKIAPVSSFAERRAGRQGDQQDHGQGAEEPVQRVAQARGAPRRGTTSVGSATTSPRVDARGAAR